MIGTGSPGAVGASPRSILDFWEGYFRVRWLDRGLTPPRGSGYKAFQRLKWYVERRLDENGGLPTMARWRAYETELAKSSTRVAGAETEPQWRSLGPDNVAGRILAHAFDPTDSQILWVGSASGGLWRSPDAGASWQAMTDQLPSLAVSAVVISPTGRNLMLIGTGEGYFNIGSVEGVGVLKSMDGGVTWRQTSFAYPQLQQVSCFGLVWHPTEPATVYLAASNGAWASHDEGDTWQLLNPGRIVSLALDPTDPRRLYIARVDNHPDSTHVLLRSTDSGATWSPIMSGITEQIGFTGLAISPPPPR
jgi:hypothetical protein